MSNGNSTNGDFSDVLSMAPSEAPASNDFSDVLGTTESFGVVEADFGPSPLDVKVEVREDELLEELPIQAYRDAKAEERYAELNAELGARPSEAEGEWFRREYQSSQDKLHASRTNTGEINSAWDWFSADSYGEWNPLRPFLQQTLIDEEQYAKLAEVHRTQVLPQAYVDLAEEGKVPNMSKEKWIEEQIRIGGEAGENWWTYDEDYNSYAQTLASALAYTDGGRVREGLGYTILRGLNVPEAAISGVIREFATPFAYMQSAGADAAEYALGDDSVLAMMMRSQSDALLEFAKAPVEPGLQSLNPLDAVADDIAKGEGFPELAEDLVKVLPLEMIPGIGESVEGFVGDFFWWGGLAASVAVSPSDLIYRASRLGAVNKMSPYDKRVLEMAQDIEATPSVESDTFTLLRDDTPDYDALGSAMAGENELLSPVAAELGLDWNKIVAPASDVDEIQRRAFINEVGNVVRHTGSTDVREVVAHIKQAKFADEIASGQQVLPNNMTLVTDGLAVRADKAGDAVAAARKQIRFDTDVPTLRSVADEFGPTTRMSDVIGDVSKRDEFYKKLGIENKAVDGIVTTKGRISLDADAPGYNAAYAAQNDARSVLRYAAESNQNLTVEQFLKLYSKATDDSLQHISSRVMQAALPPGSTVDMFRLAEDIGGTGRTVEKQLDLLVRRLQKGDDSVVYELRNLVNGMATSRTAGKFTPTEIQKATDEWIDGILKRAKTSRFAADFQQTTEGWLGSHKMGKNLLDESGRVSGYSWAGLGKKFDDKARAKSVAEMRVAKSRGILRGDATTVRAAAEEIQRGRNVLRNGLTRVAVHLHRFSRLDRITGTVFDNIATEFMAGPAIKSEFTQRIGNASQTVGGRLERYVVQARKQRLQRIAEINRMPDGEAKTKALAEIVETDEGAALRRALSEVHSTPGGTFYHLLTQGIGTDTLREAIYRIREQAIRDAQTPGFVRKKSLKRNVLYEMFLELENSRSGITEGATTWDDPDALLRLQKMLEAIEGFTLSDLGVKATNATEEAMLSNTRITLQASDFGFRNNALALLVEAERAQATREFAVRMSARNADQFHGEISEAAGAQLVEKFTTNFTKRLVDGIVDSERAAKMRELGITKDDIFYADDDFVDAPLADPDRLVDPADTLPRTETDFFDETEALSVLDDADRIEEMIQFETRATQPEEVTSMRDFSGEDRGILDEMWEWAEGNEDDFILALESYRTTRFAELGRIYAGLKKQGDEIDVVSRIQEYENWASSRHAQLTALLRERIDDAGVDSAGLHHGAVAEIAHSLLHLGKTPMDGKRFSDALNYRFNTGFDVEGTVDYLRNELGMRAPEELVNTAFAESSQAMTQQVLLTNSAFRLSVLRATSDPDLLIQQVEQVRRTFKAVDYAKGDYGTVLAHVIEDASGLMLRSDIEEMLSQSVRTIGPKNTDHFVRQLSEEGYYRTVKQPKEGDINVMLSKLDNLTETIATYKEALVRSEAEELSLRAKRRVVDVGTKITGMPRSQMPMRQVITSVVTTSLRNIINLGKSGQLWGNLTPNVAYFTQNWIGAPSIALLTRDAGTALQTTVDMFALPFAYAAHKGLGFGSKTFKAHADAVRITHLLDINSSAGVTKFDMDAMVEGLDMTYAEVADLAAKHGIDRTVLNVEFGADKQLLAEIAGRIEDLGLSGNIEFAGQTTARGGVEQTFGGLREAGLSFVDRVLLPTNRGLFASYASKMDQYYRIREFVRSLQSGADETVAAQNARDILLDYTKLTQEEKDYIAKGFFIYSFPRMMTAAAFNRLIENPQAIYNMYRIARGDGEKNNPINNLRGEDELDFINSYANSWNKDKAIVKRLFTEAGIYDVRAVGLEMGGPGAIFTAIEIVKDIFDVPLALTDVNTTAKGEVTDLFQNYLSSASPIVQLAITMGTEKEAAFGDLRNPRAKPDQAWLAQMLDYGAVSPAELVASPAKEGEANINGYVYRWREEVRVDKAKTQALIMMLGLRRNIQQAIDYKALTRVMAPTGYTPDEIEHHWPGYLEALGIVKTERAFNQARLREIYRYKE